MNRGGEINRDIITPAVQNNPTYLTQTITKHSQGAVQEARNLVETVMSLPQVVNMPEDVALEVYSQSVAAQFGVMETNLNMTTLANDHQADQWAIVQRDQVSNSSTQSHRGLSQGTGVETFLGIGTPRSVCCPAGPSRNFGVMALDIPSRDAMNSAAYRLDFPPPGREEGSEYPWDLLGDADWAYIYTGDSQYGSEWEDTGLALSGAASQVYPSGLYLTGGESELTSDLMTLDARVTESMSDLLRETKELRVFLRECENDRFEESAAKLDFSMSQYQHQVLKEDAQELPDSRYFVSLDDLEALALEPMEKGAASTAFSPASDQDPTRLSTLQTGGQQPIHNLGKAPSEPVLSTPEDRGSNSVGTEMALTPPDSPAAIAQETAAATSLPPGSRADTREKETAPESEKKASGTLGHEHLHPVDHKTPHHTEQEEPIFPSNAVAGHVPDWVPFAEKSSYAYCFTAQDSDNLTTVDLSAQINTFDCRCDILETVIREQNAHIRQLYSANRDLKELLIGHLESSMNLFKTWIDAKINRVEDQLKSCIGAINKCLGNMQFRPCSPLPRATNADKECAETLGQLHVLMS